MKLTKMQVIRDYLGNRFPDARYDDEIGFDRYGHKFRIVANGSVFLLSVSASSIEDNETEKLAKALEVLDMIIQLKNNLESTVI